MMPTMAASTATSSLPRAFRAVEPETTRTRSPMPAPTMSAATSLAPRGPMSSCTTMSFKPLRELSFLVAQTWPITLHICMGSLLHDLHAGGMEHIPGRRGDDGVPGQGHGAAGLHQGTGSVLGDQTLSIGPGGAGGDLHRQGLELRRSGLGDGLRLPLLRRLHAEGPQGLDIAGEQTVEHLAAPAGPGLEGQALLPEEHVHPLEQGLEHGALLYSRVPAQGDVAELRQRQVRDNHPAVPQDIPVSLVVLQGADHPALRQLR